MPGIKGRPLTQEHREKIANALRGRKRPEASIWLHEKLSGRPLSEEHKAKIKAGMARAEKKGRPPTPWRERFWAKVDKNGPKFSNKGKCHIWTGAKDGGGYGLFTPNGGFTTTTGGRMFKAHRFLYEQEVGPVPEGLEMDHLCRVRNCVNLKHLEPVTRKENWARSRPYRDHILSRGSDGRWVRKEAS